MSVAAQAEVLAGFSAGLAVLVGTDLRAHARIRLLRTGGQPRQPVRPSRWHRAAHPAAALGAAGVVAGLVVAGSALTVALGVPVLLMAGLRRHQARSRRRDEADQITAALPGLADLLAACLEAGAAPADALDAVRTQFPGPLAARLAPVAGGLRAGLDPLAMYGDHGPADPVRGLVRALARALESGSPLAETVSGVARDVRQRKRWAAEAAARRAGVQAVGPLVVCYLPAFILLGIVPIVVGTATHVLHDLS